MLSLCLTDTSKEEDIHFNDMFVDEGYAVFEPESGAVKAQVHEEVSNFLFVSFLKLNEAEGKCRRWVELAQWALPSMLKKQSESQLRFQ